MAISKVIYKSSASAQGVTWMDATSATAAASDIIAPKTAMLADGVVTEGTGSGGTTPTIQSLSVTPSTSQQTFNAAGVDGYKPVVVAAMPSGSATAPATISGSSASVSTGTNTLTLSKTVSVTPSVTAGYVASGTAGNSNVSLTTSVTTQGAQTIHPSTTDQTIGSGRYLTGTQTIKAVTLSNLTADNIKSGVTVKVGDSTDDDCVASVTGTYSGGGGSSMNIQVDNTNHRIGSTSYTDTGATLTVSTAGTYDIYWSSFRSSTSSGTNGTQWYKNDVAQGSAYTSWSNSYCQSIKVSGVSLAKNDIIKIYARSSSNSRYVCVSNLTIIQTA